MKSLFFNNTNNMSILKKVKTNYYLKLTLCSFIISLTIFLPFIIKDKGYFIYYGDFNVQEIPFYKLAHDAVKSGKIFWDFNTDLGANFIGSYSFYMLGSPFFWITLPFPNSFVPYLMGPLLILKFICASLTSFLYLKRYVRNKDTAILGALLYTFSGFSIYNIFFNHFHEAIVSFPLLLYACDEFMYKKRRCIFAISVSISCLMNYYFFAGQAVFVVIYWCVRFFSKSWRINLKQFLYLMFETIIGVAMSSILLIPSFLSVLQNPRINNFPNGFSALLYSYEQRYLHIITSLFFPPDIPARPNFTPGSEAKWASVAAWLPFFGMSGVIAYLKNKPKTWLRRMICILFFMAMVPILNSAFQFFNAAFYTRWFYMLTLMMSLATIKSLQDTKVNLKNGTLWSLGITIVLAISIGLMPNNGKSGLMTYPDRFWTYVVISTLGLVTLISLIIISKNNKTKIIVPSIILTSSFAVATSIYIITLGKSCSYDVHNFIIPHCINQTESFSLQDLDSSRVDIYNGFDNQAMFFKMKTIQAFHSIVPGSIMDFYPTVGVTRDVGSRPETRYYGLRSLTSCKYLLSYKDFDKTFNATIMPGWNYFGNQNNFDIWENKYYIPFGFTYDSYMSKEDYKVIDQSNRHLALLKSIVLEDESISRNADILSKSIVDQFIFTREEYYKDCTDRNLLTCTDFKIDRFGFSAKINVPDEKERLVFFSVPYEPGFSAKVNDVDVTIEKANIGFMAVRVPAGQISNIRFNYMTPGLIPGIFITFSSTIIYLGYTFFVIKRSSYSKFQNRKTYRVIRKS